MVAALLVLYPLSAGPFVWAFDRGHIEYAAYHRIKRTVYGPLRWAMRTSPAINDAVVGYLELWTGHR